MPRRRTPAKEGEPAEVVLDPFWFSQQQRGQRDNWKRTLGTEQYQWLARTLETSGPRMKFVFIHHPVGGATPEGRGGVEAAPFYEWGGRNGDGSEGFKGNRPGWPAPTIHELLVKNRMTAVFHGHDHLYVKQNLNGIVHQDVSQPGTPGYNRTRVAAEYGYKSGVILGSSGHLRVAVSAGQAKVDYIHADKSVAHSHGIPAKKGKP